MVERKGYRGGLGYAVPDLYRRAGSVGERRERGGRAVVVGERARRARGGERVGSTARVCLPEGM